MTCVRYFADGVVSLKGLGAGLKSINPDFKIDGGELTCGPELIGEVEIAVSGSDLFDEDLQTKIQECQRANAHQVVSRLQVSNSIVTIRVIDGDRDPAVTWDMLSPVWTVLPSLSPGLTQVDGQGIYDGSQLIVALA